MYEIDMQLVASIMNALSPHFSDYVIYGTNSSDIIIAARPIGTIEQPNSRFLSMTDFVRELRRINILGLPDINVRLIGSKATLAPFFNSYAITANSDYAPVVDLYTVKSRFFHSKASDLIFNIGFERLPINQMIGKQHPDLSSGNVTYSSYPKSQNIHVAEMFYHYFIQGTWKWDHPDDPLAEGIFSNAKHAKQILTNDCSENILKQEWWTVMLNTTARILPYLSTEQAKRLMQLIESPSCSIYFSDQQRKYILLIKAVKKRDPHS